MAQTFSPTHPKKKKPIKNIIKLLVNKIISSVVNSRQINIMSWIQF